MGSYALTLPSAADRVLAAICHSYPIARGAADPAAPARPGYKHGAASSTSTTAGAIRSNQGAPGAKCAVEYGPAERSIGQRAPGLLDDTHNLRGRAAASAQR